MTASSLDDGNYDVQFSIRVPKALADQINARAEREGIKPSAWIRNAIARTIENKDQAAAEDIRAPLLRILQQDEAVRSIIREITQTAKTSTRPADEIQKELTAALEDREKLYERINALDHLFQDLRARRIRINRHLADITSEQKKALSDFMQTPENRDYIQRLDELTVELSRMKSELEAVTMKYEDVGAERAELRDKLAFSEARVFQVQEEMRSHQNKGLFNENMRRITRRKKLEEDMK